MSECSHDITTQPLTGDCNGCREVRRLRFDLQDAGKRIKELEAELQIAKGSIITIKSCYENESMEHDKTRATIQQVRELPDKWREDCCVSIAMVKLAVELKADELDAMLEKDDE